MKDELGGIYIYWCTLYIHIHNMHIMYMHICIYIIYIICGGPPPPKKKQKNNVLRFALALINTIYKRTFKGRKKEMEKERGEF